MRDHRRVGRDDPARSDGRLARPVVLGPRRIRPPRRVTVVTVVVGDDTHAIEVWSAATWSYLRRVAFAVGGYDTSVIRAWAFIDPTTGRPAHPADLVQATPGMTV